MCSGLNVRSEITGDTMGNSLGAEIQWPLIFEATHPKFTGQMD